MKRSGGRLLGAMVRSITLDNRSEFAEFRGIEQDTGTDERVREVICLLNYKPRKCLGWLSPEEFSLKCCT